MRTQPQTRRTTPFARERDRARRAHEHGLRRALALAAVFLLLLGTSGCASWRHVARDHAWTLYAKDALSAGETESYARAIRPAVECVSAAFGPFERRVSLYVWDGEAPEELGRLSGVRGANDGDARSGPGAVQDVPGIGPARVRAFHARTSGLFGPSSGIYLGTPETGTIAHELVHARLAEQHRTLPLWLEEGIACVVGDGYLDGERWIVDGLSCWPLRELANERIDDAELERLLALTADDTTDVRTNVLAHFVGWAIAFDLYREAGTIDWRAWIASYGRHIELADARTRLRHTLAPDTLEAWLARLDDPRPGVRIATAKGLWKLRSPVAVEALLDRLDKEEDPLVRVALAINALASAGELRLREDIQRRMWSRTWPVLRRGKLADAREQHALEQLAASFRWSARQDARAPLDVLRNYWAE